MGGIEESQEAVICQLCREPIWNFLCIDCLSQNVEKWLPKKLVNDFNKFHQTIKSHFHTFIADNYEPCLDCRKFSETPLCPYCYTHEVYHWISPISPETARDFSKIFFFYPFEGTENITSETDPIEGYENIKTRTGFCDICLEYSELLIQSTKGWSCEGCSED